MFKLDFLKCKEIGKVSKHVNVISTHENKVVQTKYDKAQKINFHT